MYNVLDSLYLLNVSQKMVFTAKSKFSEVISTQKTPNFLPTPPLVPAESSSRNTSFVGQPWFG